MRTALIADIHGNLLALEAVLFDLEREPVERLFCLGDVAALGPQPSEVVARLRGLGCPSVLGNTDAWLLDDEPNANFVSREGIVMAELASWCVSRLSERDLGYLQTCPPTMKISLDGEDDLLCFHGSPHSYDEVISATTSDEVLSDMLSVYNASIFVGGHTHVQLFRRHGGVRLINPGSVGLPGVGPGTSDLPVNRHVSWAEYAVLTTGKGHLGVDSRRVPVDVEQMLASAYGVGMPHADWWCSKWGSSRSGGCIS